MAVNIATNTKEVPEQQEDQRLIPKIFMIGQPNLQNSLLVGFIGQSTRIDCNLLEHSLSDKAELLTKSRSLVLIDVETFSITQISELLDEMSNAKMGESDDPVMVALINTPPEPTFENLISWPEIRGIFYKNTSQKELVKGILAMFKGEYWISRRLLANYLEQHRTRPRNRIVNTKILTKRERQILQLTATGATNTEIAGKLNVSMHTVKTHIYNLFKKINVSNRIQAVNWAKENMLSLVEDTP